MSAIFAMGLWLVAPQAAQEPAPATASAYEADMGCLASFTIAQAMLRRGDPRQDQIAAVMPALRTRMETRIADSGRDEGQFAVEFQEAVNSRRATFESELPACLEREAAQP